MRKAREARAKAEAYFVERARAWTKAKAKGGAEIASLADNLVRRPSLSQGQGIIPTL